MGYSTELLKKMLAEQKSLIEDNNKNAKTDINRNWEQAAAQILNIIFGWQLEDLNKNENPRYPAIDLGDKINRIGVSVTSRSERRKFRSDIQKFLQKGLNKQYSVIYFFILGKIKKHKPFNDFPKGVMFSDDNIIDFSRLIQLFDNLHDTNKQNQILEIINKLKYPEPKHLLRAEPSHFCNFLENSRDNELEKMDKLFESTNLVFLYGIRGIGKTELAIEWGRKHYNTYIVTFHNSIIDTVISMNFTDYIYVPSNESLSAIEQKEENFQNRLNILRKEYSYATIIIDDFYDENRTFGEICSTKDFTDLINLDTKFIFTTRYEITEHSIEVKELDENKLLKLIKSHYPIINEESEDISLRKLIREVDYHTITVDLIGKTLRDSYGEITPTNLLKLFRSHDLNKANTPLVLSDQNRYDFEFDHRERKIYEHLSILFEVSSLSENNKNVLRHAVLIPLTGMPVKIFRDSHVDNERKDINSFLFKRMWLQMDRNEQYIRIHSIIREVCRKELKPSSDNCTEFIEECLKNIKESTKDAFELHFLSIEFLEQVIDVIGDITGKYCGQCSFSYRILGDYNKSFEFIEKAIDRCEPRSNNHASYLNQAGIIKAHIDDYSSAVIFHEEAKKIIEDEKYNGLRKIYNDLGRAYSGLGKLENCSEYYDRAEKYFKMALMYKENNNEDENPIFTGRLYRNIGNTLMKKKMYSNAIEEYKIAESFFNQGCDRNKKNEDDFARLYADLGNAYSALNNDLSNIKALEYRKKALEIARRLYNQEHPRLADALKNIAQTYRMTKEFDIAIEYLKKSEEILKKRLPQNYLQLARCQYYIGETYWDKTRNTNGKDKNDILNALLAYFDALYSFDNAYNIFYRPKEKAKCLNAIGNLYEKKSEKEKACKYLSKAIDILESQDKYDYQDLISKHHHLGELLRQCEKWENAIKEYSKEKEIRREYRLDDANGLINCCCRIADAYKKMSESKITLISKNMAQEYKHKAAKYLFEALDYIQKDMSENAEKEKKKIKRTLECIGKIWEMPNWFDDINIVPLIEELCK